MKKIILFLLLFVTSLSMSSCFVTKTYIGEKSTSYITYSRGKQCFLFWGLLPVGHPKTAAPSNVNCMVSTKLGFVDMLIETLTGGLFSTMTVTVKIPAVVNAPSGAGPSTDTIVVESPSVKAKSSKSESKKAKMKQTKNVQNPPQEIEQE